MSPLMPPLVPIAATSTERTPLASPDGELVVKLHQRLGQRFRFLARGPLGPLFVAVWRLFHVSLFLGSRIRLAARWLLSSRETTNFTYDITERNINHICAAIAVALGEKPETIRRFADEVLRDEDLARHVIGRTRESPFGGVADPAFRIGRRVGWYALVRATKPRVVVETGVDKGLGAVVLCAALLRNGDEDHQGQYYGTEIKPEGGYLLSGPYAHVGRILHGDSVRILRDFDRSIDVFINDSDHSEEYEAAEYRTIRQKLGPNAVVVGDNAHCTDALWRFSRELEWPFLFVGEEPRDHWYPGAGIGLCVSPMLGRRV